jgi:hypothetical protein
MTEEKNNFQEQKTSTSSVENLKMLLEENLTKNEEVLVLVKDIKKYMRWQVIWSFVRLFIIFIPIVLGVIYLPPIVKDILGRLTALLVNPVN